jgi:4-hydroxybenzoate polyprenyltransferase
MTSPKKFTDINFNHIAVKALPQKTQPFFLLMRWDRPIGAWLLFFPSLWGLILAEHIRPHSDFLWLVFLFFIGSILMRGAGCIINDMWDRKIDQQVERTALRPLASGAVSMRQAFFVLGILCSCSSLILFQLSNLAILLGLLSLLFIALYPLAKRVTYFPQLVLAVTFNMGVLIGATAAGLPLNGDMILLFGAALFWTLGYDTIYAHQDVEDDLKIGVKSTALFFKDKSPYFVSICYGLFALLFFAVGFAANFQNLFFVVWCFASFHLIWQLRSWDAHSPLNSLIQFKSNFWTGLLFSLALGLAA